MGCAAGVPAAHPDLEMEVGSGRAPGGAHLADELAGAHPLAGYHRDRALPHVHEHVVVVLALAVEHHVVARATGLELDHLDHSPARGHQRGALVGREVLTLMCVALARSAEARVDPAPAEDAGDGEGVVAKLDGRGTDRTGSPAQVAARDVKQIVALRQRGAGLEAGEGHRVAARLALAEVDRGEPRAVGRVQHVKPDPGGAAPAQGERHAGRSSQQKQVFTAHLERGQQRGPRAPGAARRARLGSALLERLALHGGLLGSRHAAAILSDGRR